MAGPFRTTPTKCSKGRANHLTRYGNPACKAHKSEQRGGACCKHDPMRGQTTCTHHGGKAGYRRRVGATVVAEAKVVAAARKLIPDVADREAIANPLEKLLELASEADAFRESLRILSNKLDNKIRYFGAAGGEQLRAEVATYRVAMRDTADLLVAIAKLDIEERLARISERRLDLVMKALTSGLADAELPDEMQRTVIANVGRHLRLVASR